MYCVAICDDEMALCTHIEKALDYYVKKGAVKTEVFYSGEKLWQALTGGQHYDLIFLDIELGNLSGVDVGNKIRNELNNGKVQIVYISAKQEYAMELFAIRPMNFLIKPITHEAVIDNVERAMELSDMYDAYFEFKVGVERFRIPYGDIIFFESRSRKVMIHTNNRHQEIYGKLNTIEKEAPPNFIRIHQSYLINRFYVTYWKAGEVILKDEIPLTISKKYQKQVNQILLQSER